ncbi:hypothetical protein BH11ARM2_BH11ARM2_21310 [soil metagenome]
MQYRQEDRAMSFDIDHLHIDAASPEGESLQAIISREQVSPEEAIRRILRDAGRATGPRKERRGPKAPNLDVAATDSIIGMFADRPDLNAAVDAIVAGRTERYAGR